MSEKVTSANIQACSIDNHVRGHSDLGVQEYQCKALFYRHKETAEPYIYFNPDEILVERWRKIHPEAVYEIADVIVSITVRRVTPESDQK